MFSYHQRDNETCCEMSILNHDKMSSRVVLENDGAAYGKVTNNTLLRSVLRERGGRVIAKLVVQNPVVAYSSAF